MKPSTSKGRPESKAVGGALWSWALGSVIVVLAASCARAGARAPAPEARLPVGAHVISAASQRAAWCRSVERRDLCEDFRNVSVADVVRFERQFPSILMARGFSREAEQVAGYQRFYRAVFRQGQLFIRGSLVCRDRMTDDGVVLLIPTCPFIKVTFPAANPQQVEFVVE